MLMEFYRPKPKIIRDLFQNLLWTGFFSIMLLSPGKPLWYQVVCYILIALGIILFVQSLAEFRRPFLIHRNGNWYLRTVGPIEFKITKVETRKTLFFDGLKLSSARGFSYFLRRDNFKAADWQTLLTEAQVRAQTA